MFHSCYFILNVSVIVVDMFMHDTLGLLIIFRLVPFFPPNHNQVYTVFSHRTMDSCAGCIAREAVFFQIHGSSAVIYFFDQVSRLGV